VFYEDCCSIVVYQRIVKKAPVRNGISRTFNPRLRCR